MTREKANHTVVMLCRVLDVSPSGYYAWRVRVPSAHAQQDQVLTAHIQAFHQQSRQTYGAPRIHADLRGMGVPCGRKRVARLMRRARLVGCHRRKFTVTTRREPMIDQVRQRAPALWLHYHLIGCTAPEMPSVCGAAESISLAAEGCTHHRYSSGRDSPAGGAGTRPYLTQTGCPRVILNT